MKYDIMWGKNRNSADSRQLCGFCKRADVHISNICEYRSLELMWKTQAAFFSIFGIRPNSNCIIEIMQVI